MSVEASSLASEPPESETSARVGELKVEESSSADASLDLVVVHGLHRATGKHVASEQDNQTMASLKTAFESSTGRTIRLMTYNYLVTDLNWWTIRREAFNLLHALQALRDVALAESDDQQVPRPIIFIAQDIGGVIVKDTLVQSVSIPRLADTIAFSVRGLIFVACPHRHDGPHTLEDQLLGLLQRSAMPSRSLSVLAQKLASAIKQINGEFIHTKLLLSSACVTVFSTGTNQGDQVFDEYTATLNTPFEKTIGWTSSHEKLLDALFDKSGDKSSIFSGIAAKTWPSAVLTRSKVHTPKSMALLRTLASIASPIYPPEDVLPGPLLPEGCRDNLDDFRKSKQNRLLHIQANTDAETSLLTRCLFQYLSRSASPNSVPIVHFTFQRGDVRFENIGPMLATLLAHLAFNKIYSHADVIREIMVSSGDSRLGAADGLLGIWRRFRISELDPEVIYIFGSVDQCDESSQDLLYWLEFMASHSEVPLKVVITSTTGTGNRVEEAFLSCPSDVHQRFNVSDQDGQRLVQSSRYITQMATLPELSPIYMEYEPRLAHLLAQMTGGDTIRQATVDWLRHTRLPFKDVETVLNTLGDTTLSGGLDILFDSIPAARQLWSRRLLSFVCASLRPLRVMELCAASHIANLLPDMSLEIDSASYEKPLYLRDQLDDILQWLGAFLKITNDEFHLAHPSLLVAVRSRPQWDEAQQHKDILDVCTAHLRQRLVVKTQPDFIKKPGVPDDLAGFGLVNLAKALPYATEYWSRHYQLLRAAPDRSDGSNTVLDDQIRNLLKEGPFEDPLVASAELGLAHLVPGYVSAPSQQREPALIAAARNGHVEVIKTLLETSMIDKMDYTVLAEAAKAASLSKPAEAFRYVIQQLSKVQHSHPQPTLPSTLIYRAAWLGQNDTIQALLGLGMTASPDELDDNISPMHAAVVFDRVETVTVLLGVGGDVTAKTSSRGLTPLDGACIYGSARCVEKLLSHLDHVPVVAGLDRHDSGSALRLAVFHGNFEVAEMLLKRDKLRNSTAEDCREIYSNALQAAIERGRIRGAKLLLQYGADPNFGWPLSSAIQRGEVEIVSLLLDHHASVDTVEPSTKRTVLHMAAFLGNGKIIKMLLEAKANIEIRDEHLYTPIWTAARNEHADAVEILAAAGADVNVASYWKDWTPLHVSYDMPAVMRVLLRYNADIDRLAQGDTPLRLATVQQRPDVMKLLLQKGASLEKSKKDGETLFASAVTAWHGNIEVLRLLLEWGEDVNQPIGSFFAIEYAIVRASSEMVELLLEFTPNLRLRDSNGNTVLNHISENTPVRSVQRLVNAGADPNAENTNGHAGLCEAIAVGNVEVARYLLQSRMVNRHGITHDPSWGGLVYHATHSGSLEMLKLLAEADEDMSAISPTLGGAVASACFPIRTDDEDEAKLCQIILFLIKELKLDVRAKGGILGCAINVAASRCGPKVIRTILTAGARIDDTDVYGRSPIHLACQNHLAALEALQVPNDHFTKKDKFGRLPLHFAAVSGSVELARYVLERSEALGIHIDAVDHHGWTALMWAARAPVVWPAKAGASRDDHEHVIRFLLDKKADPCATGRMSGHGEWTPLSIATYHGASATILSLLSTGRNSAPLSGSTGKSIGVEQRWTCDGCLTAIHGYCHVCLSCGNCDLCDKCFQSNELHSCQDWSLKGDELTVDDHVAEDEAGDELDAGAMDDFVIEAEEESP